ncbi:MAG: hypothetical protein ACOH2M_17165 [Cypionkella sp.]
MTHNDEHLEECEALAIDTVAACSGWHSSKETGMLDRHMGDHQMNTSRIAIALFTAVLLAGCSTTTADLEKSPSTKSATRHYAENYQEIFRRVHDTAAQCTGGMVIAFSTTSVVGQLYNELGYGEITYSLTNVGVKNYYWKVRVEKAGTGALMTVHSGNTINNAASLEDILRWAGGDTEC